MQTFSGNLLKYYRGDLIKELERIRKQSRDITPLKKLASNKDHKEDNKVLDVENADNSLDPYRNSEILTKDNQTIHKFARNRNNKSNVSYNIIRIG